MATATVTNDVTGTNNGSLPITPSNETYRAYVKLDDKGKVEDVRVVTAGKDNATWNELDNPTKPENQGYIKAIEQTFRTYKVGSLDAAQKLFDNDEELVNVINAAIAAKTTRKINAYLKELNETEDNIKADPSDTPVDTIDFLQEETRRKNLSPVEKAMKTFKIGIKAMFPNLTDDELTEKVKEMMGIVQS